MILAISGSPRKNRMTHNTIKKILEHCDEDYEIISLSGKKINGCIACTLCAKDNICKVQDDWNEIGKKMSLANIIIFGAPNYYGTINSLAHACLERTFAFRHKNGFTLEGKLGITVTTQRKGITIDPVKKIIEQFMESNQMEVIGHVTCDEYSQCYTCGYGSDCEAGSVVREHGIIPKILPCHLPKEIDQQENTLKNIDNIISILKERGAKIEK